MENLLYLIRKDEDEKFYYDKTHERLDLFLSTRDNRFNDPHTVNDVDTPPIKTLLSSVDMRPLYEGLPTQLFHGDLQFDNVICSGDDLFYLLDWRQDFGGSYTGDVYYDLAKLMHGLIISHDIINNDLYSFDRSMNEIKYDFFKNN